MMLLINAFSFAQTEAINSNNSAPDASGVQDVSSTDKGLLAPRMTASQKDAISSPATGLLIYQTDAPSGYYYNSGTPASPIWTQVGRASDSTQWTTIGSNIYYNSGNAGVGTISPVGRLHLSTGSKWSNHNFGASLIIDGTLNNAIALLDHNSANPWAIANSEGAFSIAQMPALGNTTSNPTPRLTISTDGHVGIGTTSPNSALTIYDGFSGISLGTNESGSTQLKIALSASSNGYSILQSIHSIGSFFGNLILNPDGGQVGIGTTNPKSKLHINSTNSSAAAITASISGSGRDGLRLETDFAFSSIPDDYALRVISTTDASDAFYVKWNNGAYFAGNVGIGTTTPSEKLEVNGIIQSKDESNNGFLYLGGSNVSLRSSYSNNVLGFYTDNAERIRIDRKGNVTIGGIIEPLAPLHIAAYSGYYADSVSALSNYFSFGETTTPYKSHITNSVSIYAQGQIVAGGDIAIVSDIRIKENVQPIENSINTIQKLAPIRFNKKDRVVYGDRDNLGFIAQEVEKILPEAVNTGTGEIPVLLPFDNVEFEDGVSYTIIVKNGDSIIEQKYTTANPRPEGEIIVKSKTVDDFKSITYDMIITVAVDAIQEQQVLIETLQSENAAMKADLEALKSAVKKLEGTAVTR